MIKHFIVHVVHSVVALTVPLSTQMYKWGLENFFWWVASFWRIATLGELRCALFTG